jgi:hypothetical protein
MLRYFGAGLPWAYAGQALAAAAALVVVARAWLNPRFAATERTALTIFAATLAAPYLFTVDLVACAIALAVLAEQRRWRIGPLDTLCWLWPMLSPVLYLKTGWLLTPLVMALLMARIWWRADLPPLRVPATSPATGADYGEK